MNEEVFPSPHNVGGLAFNSKTGGVKYDAELRPVFEVLPEYHLMTGLLDSMRQLFLIDSERLGPIPQIEHRGLMREVLESFEGRVELVYIIRINGKVILKEELQLTGINTSNNNVSKEMTMMMQRVIRNIMTAGMYKISEGTLNEPETSL